MRCFLVFSHPSVVASFSFVWGTLNSNSLVLGEAFELVGWQLHSLGQFEALVLLVSLGSSWFVHGPRLWVPWVRLTKCLQLLY